MAQSDDPGKNDTPAASTIRELLATQAAVSARAIALAAPEREALSYGRLLAQVDAVAASLRSLGVGQGDRVAVVLPNGPDMAVAFLGTTAVGTCAPLNPAYRAPEFEFYLDDLGACALVLPAGATSPAREVADSRGIPIVELTAAAEAGAFTLSGPAAGAPAAPGSAAPDDVALVLHTSGTTARPKIVPLTHANLCASALNAGRSLQLMPGDLCLNVMPLFHIHGLVAAVLSSLAAGAGVVCTPGFDGSRFFGWLDEFRPTWYTAVPTMHQAVLAHVADGAALPLDSSLRLIRSCSSALPPQVMAQLEAIFGVPVVEAYGMTEAAHQMTCNPLPPRERKPRSVGLAAGPEVAIMDDEGNLLPAGQTGEVVIRGPNVTGGYAGNAEANRRAFTDGWFRTGDEGRLDEKGYLFLTDRIKEIINRGGEKVSPR